MSADVMANPPIGGQFISSFNGVPAFLPFQGALCSGSDGAGPGTPDGLTYLDILRAMLTINSTLKNYTHSGSYGGRGTNKTAESWTVQGELVVDLTKDPDMLTKNGQRTDFWNWDTGFQLWFFLGDNDMAPTDIGGEFFYAPSAKIAVQSNILDANAEEDLQFKFVIMGNSRIFKIPEEVDEYDLYMGHCGDRNWAK